MSGGVYNVSKREKVIAEFSCGLKPAEIAHKLRLPISDVVYYINRYGRRSEEFSTIFENLLPLVSEQDLSRERNSQRAKPGTFGYEILKLLEDGKKRTSAEIAKSLGLPYDYVPPYLERYSIKGDIRRQEVDGGPDRYWVKRTYTKGGNTEICENCGKEFKGKSRSKFCSRRCYAVSRFGEKNCERCGDSVRGNNIHGDLCGPCAIEVAKEYEGECIFCGADVSGVYERRSDRPWTCEAERCREIWDWWRDPEKRKQRMKCFQGIGLPNRRLLWGNYILARYLAWLVEKSTQQQP